MPTGQVMLIEILIGILVGIALVLFPLLIGIVAFFFLVKKLRNGPLEKIKNTILYRIY